MHSISILRCLVPMVPVTYSACAGCALTVRGFEWLRTFCENMQFNTSSEQLGPTGRFSFGRIVFDRGVHDLVFRSSLYARSQRKHILAFSIGNCYACFRRESPKNSKNGTTYKAEIFYDYKVNGTKHSSNRVGYGDFSSSNPSCARSVANQYPAGKMWMFFICRRNQGRVFWR